MALSFFVKSPYCIQARFHDLLQPDLTEEGDIKSV
jgi:hypothetical protein